MGDPQSDTANLATFFQNITYFNYSSKCFRIDGGHEGCEL